MNPQSLQFPLGLQQGQQQQNFNAGIQPNTLSASAVPAAPAGQVAMPAVGDSNNMGAQMQNAAQVLQVSLIRIASHHISLGFQVRSQREVGEEDFDRANRPVRFWSILYQSRR